MHINCLMYNLLCLIFSQSLQGKGSNYFTSKFTSMFKIAFVLPIENTHYRFTAINKSFFTPKARRPNAACYASKILLTFYNSRKITFIYSCFFNKIVLHKTYFRLVGDLLMMEIWECLSQGYMRLRNQNMGMKMTIGSLPPVPTQDRAYELFNISVDCK